MSEPSQLYEQILNSLIRLDERDFLPPVKERFKVARRYLAQELEKPTPPPDQDGTQKGPAQ